jgi:hypothetical protein
MKRCRPGVWSFESSQGVWMKMGKGARLPLYAASKFSFRMLKVG